MFSVSLRRSTATRSKRRIASPSRPNKGYPSLQGLVIIEEVDFDDVPHLQDHARLLIGEGFTVLQSVVDGKWCGYSCFRVRDLGSREVNVTLQLPLGGVIHGDFDPAAIYR